MSMVWTTPGFLQGVVTIMATDDHLHASYLHCRPPSVSLKDGLLPLRIASGVAEKVG